MTTGVIMAWQYAELTRFWKAAQGILATVSSVAVIIIAILLFTTTRGARREVQLMHADVTAMKTDLTAIRVIYDTIAVRLQRQAGER